MLELFQTYFAQAPAFGWNAFWVSQGLIGLALLFDMASWQFKSRGHIVLLLAASNALISTHLFLLEQPVAGFLVGLGGIRFLVSYFTTHQYVLYGFLTLGIIVSAILYQAPLDIMALFCSSIFAVASFQKTDQPLRLFMMLGSMLWITYQFLIFSPAAMLLSSIFLTSNFVGYYRYCIRDTKNLT